jgi:pimeloyl-ACP methyl ester carboxylesterase
VLVDLVNVTTEDDLRLDGALRAPAAGARCSLGVDAALCLHGTGSNFYASNMMASVAAAVIERGVAALTANTRGHDGISSTTAPIGLRLQGAAYELVDACTHDVAAWLAFLRSRGYDRLGLVGHSLGAIKAIYSQAHRPDPSVLWLVAISPPQLSHAAFAADKRGDEFLRDYERAEALVRDGRPRELIEIRYPLAYAVSAEGYLDKYGPHERYNIVRLLERVTCPLVATYGANELNSSSAFRGMPERIAQMAGADRRQVQIVAGADHFYAGMYAELWASIERGLRRLAVT